MVKKIKHVTLNRPKMMVATNDDPTRGTEENPYSIDEAYALYYAGLWVGGWVECYGYIPANLEDWGYYGSGSGTSGSCDPHEEEINPDDGDDGHGLGGNGDENGENGNQGGENHNGNQGNGNDGGGNTIGAPDNTLLQSQHYEYSLEIEANQGSIDFYNVLRCKEIDGESDVFAKGGKNIQCNRLEFNVFESEYKDPNNRISHDRDHVMEIKGGTWELYKFLVKNYSSLGEWGVVYNGGQNPTDSTPCIISTIFVEDGSNISIVEGYNSMVHSHPNSDRSPSTYDYIAARKFASKGYTFFGIVNRYNLSPSSYNP